ncbi:hypothetical protein [Lentzea sp. NPDC051838]|uniref:hypothetical protein n=1 Tax=Lentzea sp. NPDC051838 TaxID=3154849 RepID=UPI0034469536
MAASERSSISESDMVVRAVTVIMVTVVGLTFLFGFGNVFSLGLRLGVPIWVAPLVAPAVDLSILGLLLGIRHLALTGAPAAVLRPARRLLMFASAVTLALNTADPVVAGEYGKAAFDAVGPLLLIGWAEVGPGYLQAISASATTRRAAAADVEQNGLDRAEPESAPTRSECEQGAPDPSAVEQQPVPQGVLGVVVGHQTVTGVLHRGSQGDLERARRADARHWAVHKRPISSESLRKELEIGAELARELVVVLRSEVAAEVYSKVV